MTAQFMFMCNNTRPKIQVEVVFLCTQVKNLPEQDHKKLTRTIRHLQNNINLPLLIGWEELDILTWSVDAEFSIHQKMCSNTGAALKMGKGAPLSLSLKKKINTNNYSEVELFGVDDTMNFVVWTKIFFNW